MNWRNVGPGPEPGPPVHQVSTPIGGFERSHEDETESFGLRLSDQTVYLK